MFEVLNVKGNTYYFNAFSNIGIFDKGNGEAVLIDSCDHKRMVRSVDRYLSEKGLRVSAVISTHCHVDHICGNRFFYEKYGCDILCSEKEKMFIAYPDLESSFYYSGIDTDKTRNFFFMTEPSKADTITENNTPKGFEIIDLPGHSFGMIGVRTPDNVVFTADAVIAEKTWEEYKLPFFHSVNDSLQTLEKLKGMKADFFVPSHCGVVEGDIAPLAQYNIDRLLWTKEMFLSICHGKSFDEIFSLMMKELQLNIKTQKYPMYAIQVRNFLQALVEDDKIFASMKGDKFIYQRK